MCVRVCSRACVCVCVCVCVCSRVCVCTHTHTHTQCQKKDWGEHKDSCATGEKSRASLNPAQKECQTNMIAAQQCMRAGDRKGERSAYCEMGNAFFSLSQYDSAITYHTKSLKISRELKDSFGEGGAYCGLGNTFEKLGQYN